MFSVQPRLHKNRPFAAPRRSFTCYGKTNASIWSANRPSCRCRSLPSTRRDTAKKETSFPAPKSPLRLLRPTSSRPFTTVWTRWTRRSQKSPPCHRPWAKSNSGACPWWKRQMYHRRWPSAERSLWWARGVRSWPIPSSRRWFFRAPKWRLRESRRLVRSRVMERPARRHRFRTLRGKCIDWSIHWSIVPSIDWLIC